MNYLFFDIETTGIPNKGDNWETDYNNFPHIVQIAWMVYRDNELIEQFERIIKPDGWSIPEEVSKIHGISEDMALKNGDDEKFVLDIFINSAISADKIIGHNIYFDTSIVKASLLRLGRDKEKIIEALHKDKREDTSRMALQKFKGQPGNKLLTLSDLYKKLFNRGAVGAHTAMCDVKNTMMCYFNLADIDCKLNPDCTCEDCKEETENFNPKI